MVSQKRAMLKFLLCQTITRLDGLTLIITYIHIFSCESKRDWNPLGIMTFALTMLSAFITSAQENCCIGSFSTCTVKLHISYKDHVTNKEVCAKIQQAIGPHEDLLMIVKRCKLQWYGHVSRSSGLAKFTLQGTVKGWRKQGGQGKKWEDNIKEWTGLEFGKSQRAVEKREKWRKLVAKSSVVPQWPSQLRDWWWWWWWQSG